jgi:hypothetical protein
MLGRHAPQERVLRDVVEVVLARVEIVEREAAHDLQILAAVSGLLEKIGDQREAGDEVPLQEHRVPVDELRSRLQ